MTARSQFLVAGLTLLSTFAADAEPGPFAPVPLKLEVPAANVAALRAPMDYQRLSREDRLRLDELKPGLTRRQVEKQFLADGGLISPSAERYYLRGTRVSKDRVIMVEIAFRPLAMDVAVYSDLTRRQAWFRLHGWAPGNPEDVVMGVGVPYESGVAID